MNQILAAMTNWGKSYTCQHYTEENREEFDGVLLFDYKDEYAGLVEEFRPFKRLTVPTGAVTLDVDDWLAMIRENPQVQLARAGADVEEWREICATATKALDRLDETRLVVFDEAHKVAPQQEGAPDPIETLATTWHGDGYGVVWSTQRFAKIDETILAECQAALLGGFRSINDLMAIDAVEYPVEVHQAPAERVDKILPDELLVDGEPLTLRRFADDEGNTVGSEWIYTDDTTLRRIDSREWDLQSTHYGSDRVRIKQPFDS